MEDGFHVTLNRASKSSLTATKPLPFDRAGAYQDSDRVDRIFLLSGHQNMPSKHQHMLMLSKVRKKRRRLNEDFQKGSGGCSGCYVAACCCNAGECCELGYYNTKTALWSNLTTSRVELGRPDKWSEVQVNQVGSDYAGTYMYRVYVKTGNCATKEGWSSAQYITATP